MARREANGLLAALLGEADWTGGELARAVNALGTAQGLRLRYDRTSVAHWLTGSRPRPPVPDLVAAAFSRRVGRLVLPAETGLAADTRLGAPVLDPGAGAASAALGLIALCRAEALPEQRAVLTRSGYTPTAPPLPGGHTPLTPPPSAASGAVHRVLPEDVRLLREMARVYAVLSRGHGGAHARSALAAYIGDDAGRVLGATGPDRLPEEARVAVAQLVHLLAVMTADAGHDGLAQRYFSSALSLAREVGDRRQYAITLRAMSSQALRLLHRRHADVLAHAALTVHGDEADPTVRSYLLAQRALTSAHRGERREALADLADAARLHERAVHEGAPFTAYPRSGLHYQRAEVFQALGDESEGRAALRSALAHRPPGDHRPVALTHARLAESLLRIGHLDVACGHWSSFLDHYPHLHSRQVDQALAELVRRLRPHQRQRHAAAILDRARELRRR
ncbi:hypothetical protein ACF09C_00460 [Streptomyces sp. NPDC014870]|uniref:hypothetical protein n=1 Tax=Streptomyces sp. NPDC014870 TaxID=3364925 RepID=UPI0036FFC552